MEPKHGGNVGAAARAMGNFGFTDLAIVGEAPELRGEAEWWATSGGDLLESASKFDSLGAAISDCHVAVATTSERGRDEQGAMTPQDLADLVSSLSAEQRLALVFGRERSGLTRDEIEICGRVATIPTSADRPVMNLAQSVAIFCFAISSAAPREVEPATEDRASLEKVTRLHEAAIELLTSSGWANPQNVEGTYAEIRRLVARAGLTEREATLLLGIIRQLDWWGNEK